MLSVSRRDPSWKPGSAGHDIVGADAEVRKAEPAVLIGDVAVAATLVSHLRGGDGGAGDDRPGRIDDAAADARRHPPFVARSRGRPTPARTQAQYMREKET